MLWLALFVAQTQLRSDPLWCSRLNFTIAIGLT